MNPFKRALLTARKFFLSNSVDSGFWGWGIPGGWSRKALLQKYTRYVYTSISSIAENAAKIDFEMKKQLSNDNWQILKTDRFLKLMEKPNPDMSQFQFLELHFTFLKLTGESFWYLGEGKRTKEIKEIYLLRPDMIEVAVDTETPKVIGYTLNEGKGEKKPIAVENILHFKLPNPMNIYRGMGPVEAGKVYIETEDYASKWTRNSIYNSGRPSGIVNLRGVIDKKQFEQVKRQFKNEYTGSENAGKTLLIKGLDGIDFKKLGMEMAEVALKEMKDMTRDDIMIMFKMSKTMLGISDDVNRANAKEARQVFLENIIKPECDRLVDHLNAFLVPRFGKNIKLFYKDPVMTDRSETIKEWEVGFNKWLTSNEIRGQIGLKPLSGGDVIREPLNLMPTIGDGVKKLKKKLRNR